MTIAKLAAALRHAGSLDEAIRDELKSFIAPEDDSREALAQALASTSARNGQVYDAGAELADGLDTNPRSCFEYQTRVDTLAETLGWPFVDEALIRASAAFGLFLNESGTGCSFVGPLSAEDAVKVLG